MNLLDTFRARQSANTPKALNDASGTIATALDMGNIPVLTRSSRHIPVIMSGVWLAERRVFAKDYYSSSSTLLRLCTTAVCGPQRM